MRKLLKFAEGQHGAIGRWQALTFVSEQVLDGLLRDGVIEHAVRSVYRVTGSPRTWRQAVTIAVLAAGKAMAAASGATAAVLHRIPGFREGPIEVTQTRRPSRRFKVASEHSATRLPEKHVCVVDGIRTTTIERTTFDLCSRAGCKRAEHIIKAVVGAKLTTFAKLFTVLEECGGRGRKGTRLFRTLLETLSYEPSMSELEALVLRVLTAAGIAAVQEVNVGNMATPIGRIDFLIRSAGIIIEADSKQWHADWLRTEFDHRRTAQLTAAGYHVIHCNWSMLMNQPEEFIAAVRGALKRAA